MVKKSKKEEVLGEEEVQQEEENSNEGDTIEVGDPLLLRPVELPLVVKLPKSASKAQVEYAKVLNGYAYKNPTKWAKKKAELIKKLEGLKNAPDPVEETGGLKYGNKLLA